MTDINPTPWTIAYDDNDQGWIKSASGAHLVGFGTDDKDFWESIVATVNKREALLVEIEQLWAERDVLKYKLLVAHGVISPFAAEYSNWGDTPDDEHPLIRGRSDDVDSSDDAAFTVGDLRRAHEFMEKSK